MLMISASKRKKRREQSGERMKFPKDLSLELVFMIYFRCLGREASAVRYKSHGKQRDRAGIHIRVNV